MAYGRTRYSYRKQPYRKPYSGTFRGKKGVGPKQLCRDCFRKRAIAK